MISVVILGIILAVIVVASFRLVIFGNRDSSGVLVSVVALVVFTVAVRVRVSEPGFGCGVSGNGGCSDAGGVFNGDYGINSVETVVVVIVVVVDL